MRVINKLTKPGGIRRIDLLPDSVHIQTSDGRNLLYRLSTVLVTECMYCHKKMGEQDGRGVSGTSGSICRECWKEKNPGEVYPEGE